jgi:predicted amidohydrolase
MPAPFLIAGVQTDIVLAEPRTNLKRMEESLAAAAARKAQLVVFPECALTGYCFESLDEARPHAEPIPGPACLRLAETCAKLGVYAVFGLLEADGPRMYNACALVGPGGVVGSYRKVHLPHLGIDRFTTPGDRPFAVHEAGPARLGMHICYDGTFPEAGRILSLAGADLLVLPTNWPPGAENTARYVMNARAIENHVYFIAVNRVGTERGFPFIGTSSICDPTGRTLAEAPGDKEAIIFAEIDLAWAREKRIVRVPGKHIIDRFADRRPEMYGPLAAPIGEGKERRRA